MSAEPATPVRYPRAGTVTTYAGLAFHKCTAPSRDHIGLQSGSPVGVLCQTTGSRAADSRVWDKVTAGLYVPDGRLSTPGDGVFTRGLPRCRFGYQVRAPERAPVHRGPSSARAAASPRRSPAAEPLIMARG